MPLFTDTLNRNHAHRLTRPELRPKPNVIRPSATERKKPSHGEIAELAYSFWEARGHTHGSELEDWLRAERELQQRYNSIW